ncbi:MAG: phosphate signaling complex protein PhoU [Chitinispirillaceae bacterium]|nr:phosphate signaling complex protein PhoU [Chitinispirillaceae bacterium]
MYAENSESVNRDITRISDNIVEMARRAEASLRDTVTALLDNDHTLAYGVILRDAHIDDKEREIDRLCFEFIHTQQPVTKALRFAFSAVKISMEIERVGDYAESMARQLFKTGGWSDERSKKGIVELAHLSTTMFHDAIQSFIEQSAETARKTVTVEETVDAMRDKCIDDLLSTTKDGEIPLPIFNIIRRFERVADQARNICMEVLYLCTGEYMKHPGAEVIRVLFVDKHNSMRSRIAEAVADGLNRNRFIFSSAGIEPKPIDSRTIEFMRSKGYDLSATTSLALAKVPNLDYYQVIVAFSPEVKKSFPQQPRKTVYLDWEVDAPSLERDDDDTIRASLENMFEFISTHVNKLVEAIDGAAVGAAETPETVAA